MNPRIPLFRPELPPWAEIESHMARSAQRGMYTNFGPAFEDAKNLAEILLQGFALPVSNGTVAIQVALKSMHWLVPGSFVGVPEFTFAATAQAVVAAGFEPVLLPCRYSDASIDWERVRYGSFKLDAIVAVAPFGYVPPWYEAHETCSLMEVDLVWDRAGAWPLTDPFENICCYSLHAAKSLPVGEGGLVLYSSEELYEQGKSLICFSFDADKRALRSDAFNGKLDEFHCAILAAQLERHDRVVARIQRHRRLLEDYQRALGEHCDPIHEGLHAPSMVVLRGLPCDPIVQAGAAAGIVFRRYYYPLLCHHPAFNAPARLSDMRLDSYLAFPCDVSNEEFAEVVELVHSVCRSSRSGAV